LIAGNNSSKIKDHEISDDLCNWCKQKNFSSRSRRSSAGDVPTVKLRNRFSVLDVDLQSTGFLEHVKDKVKPLAWKTKIVRSKILLLVSSHRTEIEPMLKEHLGIEYEIKIF
jgi:hypothetical protein